MFRAEFVLLSSFALGALAEYYEPAAYDYSAANPAVYHHPVDRQDLGAIFSPLALVGAVGIIGLVAGGSAVNQAAAARNNIQNSINTLSPTVMTLTSGVTTAESTVTTAMASQTAVNAQLAKVCPLITTVGAIPAAANAAGALAPVMQVIAAFKATACP